MAVGWGSRTVRAAVFAAACVLLAALGHVMMSGSSVPWWALGAGAVGTGGVGWSLAHRERGLRLIATVVVAAQGVLHVAFSLAQPGNSMGHSMGSGHGMESLGMDAMDMGAMHGHPMPMPPADTSHAGHASWDSLACLVRCLGADHSLGMYAAHLLAALLCGLWLGYGERAAFRLLRAVAGWLAAPLHLLLARPAPPPHRPRVLARRSPSGFAPRRVLLVHAITRRGPPAGPAVV